METGQISEGLSGDKLYQIRARKALPILVRQALANQSITYLDLASELSMPNPRNLNYVLGSIGQSLQALSVEWKEDIPLINCLVINKTTGLPGCGIGVFFDNKNKFDKLTKKQQRDIFYTMQNNVYAYTRWLEILKHFGLKY